MIKRLYLAALLPLAAALLSLLRYWQQGDSNLYTKFDLHLYVADPDLGWRQLDEGLPWLGLDSIALLLVFGLVILVGAGLLRERSRGAKTLLWTGAALSLLLPLWAFLGGSPQGDARTTLPAQHAEQGMRGVQAHLPGLPPGSYEVLDHEGTSIVATLIAGGETFDARWSAPQGSLRLNPAKLNDGIEAHFSVDANSVDSDLGERDVHIREYLETKRYPQVTLQIQELLGTREESASSISFEASATLQLMGKAHSVQLSGQLIPLTPEAGSRLAVSDKNTLLLRAHFGLDLASTAIKDPEGLFDSLEAKISVTLLLHHKPVAPP